MVEVTSLSVEPIPRINLSDLHELNEAARKAVRSSCGAVLVRLPPDTAGIVTDTFRTVTDFFGHEIGSGSGSREAQQKDTVKGYKLQSHKERLQWKQTAFTSASSDEGFSYAMDHAFATLRNIAESGLLAAMAVVEEERSRTEALNDECAVPPLTALRCAQGNVSVLNAYNYFNKQGFLECNCRSHIDPGLATVLCRATEPGLQVLVGGPRSDGSTENFGDFSQGTSGGDDCGEGIWVDCEECMDEADVLIIWGESLQRAVGGRLQGCLHRVAPPAAAGAPRLSIAFELRPDQPIYAPYWQKVDEPTL